jgi:hypothetical protein
MVALSNWKLDESKMNRVVIANRPKLSLDELKEAAIALQNIIFPNLNQLVVLNLAIDSFNYFQSRKT